MSCLCALCRFVSRSRRCVQLVWSPEHDNPAAWAELINKIKEGILSAFDGAITQREEEVRRSEGQRQMPGWNFCTYFILKVLNINITLRSFSLIGCNVRKALHPPSGV